MSDDQLRAALRALFAGGPDTSIRTTWPDGVECWEVPADEMRAVLALLDQPTDPTHGRIDEDIRRHVDGMRPTSLGQRVALENTLQRLRDDGRVLALDPRQDKRDPECVTAWPECETGLYDPRCCRWPKSCSADVHHEGGDHR